MKKLKTYLIFSLAILLISIGYSIYAYFSYPAPLEKETFLSEIGEGFGEIGLWCLVFIYFRSLLKLYVGSGDLSQRILPEYMTSNNGSILQNLLVQLNKTHIYVGLISIAVILMHIALMGVPMQILFFPAVLTLIIWQGLFGLFLTWRYSPKELKKFSYLVHAQFITGIMIGVFSYFGHLLIDD